MIISFYFFISWVLLGLFLFNRIHQKASLKEVTFLFLLCCLLNTHTYAGLFDTFKWMKTTTDRQLFIAFLIFKNIFVPLLVTCFTLLIDISTMKKKFLLFSFFIVIILSIDLLNLSIGLYTFKEWNSFYTFIYYFIFLFFLLCTLKWFRGLASRSGGENNVMD